MLVLRVLSTFMMPRVRDTDLPTVLASRWLSPLAVTPGSVAWLCLPHVGCPGFFPLPSGIVLSGRQTWTWPLRDPAVTRSAGACPQRPSVRAWPCDPPSPHSQGPPGLNQRAGGAVRDWGLPLHLFAPLPHAEVPLFTNLPGSP